MSRRGTSRTIIAVVVIVVIIVASVGVYLLSRPSSGPSMTTVQTSAISGGTLSVDESGEPEGLDPGFDYDPPAWDVMPNIFQGLLWYNGSSTDTFVPVLAQSWTVSADGMTYTFQLRSNVTFSNGDPFNAYVMWYSILRAVLMNQGPSWILAQNIGAGNITDSMLNSMSYATPTSAQIAVMSASSNSVQVLDPHTLQFNLGHGFNGPNPYPGFLATLTVPTAAAVDPAVITANGGVKAGQSNTWALSNPIGTGQFVLNAWNRGDSIILTKNPTYWGNNLAQSNMNAEVAPAKLDKVIIYYKADDLTRELDIKSGAVQSAYVDYSRLGDVNGTQGIVVQKLGLITSINWVYMKENVFPFNVTNVREAIAYAIDTQGIINEAFAGLATKFVGPLFQGMPGYDPTIPPYSYDPAKAKELLADAGFPGGKGLPVIRFLYLSSSDEDAKAAQIIQANLNDIGISVELVGEVWSVYASMQTDPTAAATAPTMGLTHWSADYMSPDDYTVPIASASGFLMQYLSSYNNTKLNGLVFGASIENDPAKRNQMYSQIAQIMYNDYVNIWLYQRQGYAVYREGVQGIVFNPLGATLFYTHTYAQIYLTSM
ncbi:MAG TPA: ABC transporter substrate-binding protein [archaeon]|nr:ABC transporter substrate-binding protein [archaeon]